VSKQGKALGRENEQGKVRSCLVPAVSMQILILKHIPNSENRPFWMPQWTFWLSWAFQLRKRRTEEEGSHRRAALVGHDPSASKPLTCMNIHVGRMRAFGEVQDQGIRLQVNSICHYERTNQGEGWWCTLREAQQGLGPF
jgi:hypothetical protein